MHQGWCWLGVMCMMVEAFEESNSWISECQKKENQQGHMMNSDFEQTYWY